MAPKCPTYLTKNSLGIFIFQYRTPLRFIQKRSDLIKLFRKSLGTREPRKALNLARRWVVLMDELAIRYNNDLEAYSNAQRSLSKRSNKNTQANISPLSFHLDTTKSRDMNSDIELADSHYTNLRLSTALESFIVEKRKIWNPKSAHSNERDVRLKIELFIEITGDCKCQSITIEQIVDYKNNLFQIPANRSKMREYKDFGIRKLLKLNIPQNKLLSNETLTNHFNKISSFLDWCHRNGYMKPDLKHPLQRVIPNRKVASAQRDLFNDQDLNKLFNSIQYLKGTHKKPSHCFVPLIALFTGARLNEICQLYCSDIYQDKSTGIWVADINADKPDKRLKKASHARLIPLHPVLISLGFVDYVAGLSTERIFNELKFKRDGYGQSFSRWFNGTYRNVNHCNVGQQINENKNFHSFRHGFITQLSNTHNIPQHKIAHIVGHRPNDGSETIQRYTKQIDLEERFNIVNKIQWKSIEFSSIKLI